MPLDCELQTVIKFLNAEGFTEPEIHRRLSTVYGAGNVSLSHVLTLGGVTHITSNKGPSTRLDQ